ncbi:glycosyltransferase, partial [bacterium]|nr:glycosyltransferase [bacterium]
KLDNFKIYRIGWSKYFPFQNIDQQNIIQRFLWRIYQFKNKYSADNLKAILKKEKPDLILSHNVLGLGYNVIKIINQNKIKHISTIHDVQLLVPSGILKKEDDPDSLFNKIYSYFTKNAYRECLEIICPSQALVDFYKTRNFFPNSKINVLYNPIQIEENKKLDKKNNEQLKILYLGQLEEHKGILDLLKIFRQLNINNYFLTIAGRGSLKEKIENLELVISNIHFFGEFNSQQRIKLLSENDILVVPSNCFENSPMVIYEAWQAGVPVLASNTGGIPELIKEGENGWIFKNSDELMIKLKNIYQNKKQLSKMNNYCLEYVNKFDTENYIKNLLNLMN